jgi:hypothetical protein
MALGRAVSGVYNKVMNFRAIDPRDERSGMSGGGETDRRVWSEFYDEATHDSMNSRRRRTASARC